MPFSLVDEAIDHLDSRREPWSVHLEARISGRVDEVRLRAAVATALDRYPRARARRAPAGRRGRAFDWEIPVTTDVDPVGVLLTSNEAGLAAARAELQSRPLSLDRSPPLRIRLVRNPGGDVVMLHLHHAAGDGLSAVGVLRAVADSYAGRLEAGNDVVPLDASDPRALAQPGGRAARPAPGSLRAELRQWAARSSRLAPEGGARQAGYGFHQVALTREQTQAVVLGGPPRATVNDVLMAALHLAIAGWNRHHGVAGGPVGVLMPVDLRPPAWGDDVLGNFSFPVRVTTWPGDRTRPLSVVRAVMARTAQVKRAGSAAGSLASVAWLQRLPVTARRRLARAVARGPRVPTAILSNLGRVDPALDFGADLGRATEVWFSPPAPMPLGLGIGAVTAGGRLHLSFRYRHPLLGRLAAAAFADRYVEALDQVASATAG